MTRLRLRGMRQATAMVFEATDMRGNGSVGLDGCVDGLLRGSETRPEAVKRAVYQVSCTHLGDGRELNLCRQTHFDRPISGSSQCRREQGVFRKNQGRTSDLTIREAFGRE